MNLDPKQPVMTADEARRLGDKRWLVESGLWSLDTARQWLSRQTCLLYIEEQGYKLETPECDRPAGSAMTKEPRP